MEDIEESSLEDGWRRVRDYCRRFDRERLLRPYLVAPTPTQEWEWDSLADLGYDDPVTPLARSTPELSRSIRVRITRTVRSSPGPLYAASVPVVDDGAVSVLVADDRSTSDGTASVTVTDRQSASDGAVSVLVADDRSTSDGTASVPVVDDVSAHDGVTSVPVTDERSASDEVASVPVTAGRTASDGTGRARAVDEPTTSDGTAYAPAADDGSVSDGAVSVPPLRLESASDTEASRTEASGEPDELVTVLAKYRLLDERLAKYKRCRVLKSLLDDYRDLVRKYTETRPRTKTGGDRRSAIVPSDAETFSDGSERERLVTAVAESLGDGSRSDRSLASGASDSERSSRSGRRRRSGVNLRRHKTPDRISSREGERRKRDRLDENPRSAASSEGSSKLDRDDRESEAVGGRKESSRSTDGRPPKKKESAGGSEESKKSGALRWVSAQTREGPSLQECLRTKRPEFVRRADRRRRILQEHCVARKERASEHRKLCERGQVEVEAEAECRESRILFDPRAVVKRTALVCRQLSEVTERRERAKMDNWKRANRVKSVFFTKRLQREALRGVVDFSYALSLIKI